MTGNPHLQGLGKLWVNCSAVKIKARFLLDCNCFSPKASSTPQASQQHPFVFLLPDTYGVSRPTAPETETRCLKCKREPLHPILSPPPRTYSQKWGQISSLTRESQNSYCFPEYLVSFTTHLEGQLPNSRCQILTLQWELSVKRKLLKSFSSCSGWNNIFFIHLWKDLVTFLFLQAPIILLYYCSSQMEQPQQNLNTLREQQFAPKITLLIVKQKSNCNMTSSSVI